MILLLLGAAACYAALTGSALFIKTEDWWTPHPTTTAAVFTLGLVPFLATWAGAEMIRAARSPRILTRHAHPLKRLLTGLTIGLVGTAAGALAVVLLEPVNGGWAWLLMGLSALGTTVVFLVMSKSNPRGRCPRCDYDLAGVTIAAQGKCPECGLDQMVAA